MVSGPHSSFRAFLPLGHCPSHNLPGSPLRLTIPSKTGVPTPQGKLYVSLH